MSAERRAGLHVHECESLTDVLWELALRPTQCMQKERFADEKEWEKVKYVYRVDHAVLLQAKEDVVVIHPLP